MEHRKCKSTGGFNHPDGSPVEQSENEEGDRVTHVPVSVRTTLLMPEPRSVEKLVDDDAVIHATVA